MKLAPFFPNSAPKLATPLKIPEGALVHDNKITKNIRTCIVWQANGDILYGSLSVISHYNLIKTMYILHMSNQLRLSSFDPLFTKP